MNFEIKESKRAKRLSITVKSSGQVVLTKPIRVSISVAEAFVMSREEWIMTTRKQLEDRRKESEKLYGSSIQLPRLRRNTKEYKEAVKAARTRITTLVEEYAAKGPYTYTAISIRNQKTRWGSCSPKGVLSFNYRLIYLTPEELAYLAVHELAHTKHHNHRETFWEEVGRFIPQYKALRRSLKRYRW